MAKEKEKAKPKPKPEKPTFYKVSPQWGNGLSEGYSITVSRSMSYIGEKADFTPFLNVPVKELEERKKASKAEEKKVYDQLVEAAKAWDEHGAQTLLLQKAIEYLKVPEIKHTGNEWKEQKDGSWEISNKVYKMTFSIKKQGGEYVLTWEVSYTAPGLQHGYYGYTRSPRERIDHESSKKYKTMDGAQNYVQLKFDQYSKCFKELCPPVPPDAKELFCVNGQLLLGYTLGRAPAKKKEVTLDDLFDCLKDSDTAMLSTVPKTEAPKAEAKPSAPAKADKPTPATAQKEKKPEAPKPQGKKPAPKPAKKKPLHTKKMKKSAMAR